MFVYTLRDVAVDLKIWYLPINGNYPSQHL